MYEVVEHASADSELPGESAPIITGDPAKELCTTVDERHGLSGATGTSLQFRVHADSIPQGRNTGKTAFAKHPKKPLDFRPPCAKLI